MKTKMQAIMNWIASLNKDEVRIKMNEERYTVLLWGFAKSSANRNKSYVLTNGGFRFYWGHKSQAGWLNISVTFNDEEATIRVTPKENKVDITDVPELNNEVAS
jgi:hypothetical protein